MLIWWVYFLISSLPKTSQLYPFYSSFFFHQQLLQSSHICIFINQVTIITHIHLKKLLLSLFSSPKMVTCLLSFSFFVFSQQPFMQRPQACIHLTSKRKQLKWRNMGSRMHSYLENKWYVKLWEHLMLFRVKEKGYHAFLPFFFFQINIITI